tara:strand:- start:1918 stop:2223 length:306 start_codon:yes stop_codon:yes gene_type:complete
MIHFKDDIKKVNQFGIQFKEANGNNKIGMRYESINADLKCYLAYVPRILDDGCFLVASIDVPLDTCDECEEYFEADDQGLIDAIKWLEAGVTFEVAAENYY